MGAPLVRPGKKTTPSLVEYWAIRGLSKVLNTFIINNPVDPKLLAKNQEVAQLYTADPNVHPFVSFQTGCDIVLNGEYLEKFGPQKLPKHLSLLVVHGSDDFITCPKAAEAFCMKCENLDKQFVKRVGSYHEMHNDVEKEEMYELYTRFILNRVK
ncbi:hypothetical protein HDU96_008316 [Phlyctochytrium bullatum]|nr:hypothetical protein HDU96_008316 [Phlyctochytrium bullatum]